MPKKITLRYMLGFGETLIIEHDGKQVLIEDLDSPENPTLPIKAIELALKTLGYVPDLKTMYMDSDLFVLDFTHA